MKKNKLFLILSFMAAVSLFAAAAICTQCGQQAEIPTLELEIVEGPDFSEDDGMCYYQVEAKATGTPDPEIEFSDDDNVNLLDADLVEVGVDIGDSYILTAAATNDSGTADASITLPGECEEEVAEEETYEEEAADEETDIGEETAEDETDGEEAADEETAEDETDGEEVAEEETDIGEEADEDETDGEEAPPEEEAPLEEEEDNHSPVITGDIIVENLPGDDTPSGGPYKAGEVHYRVRVDVTDPDGDPLTYSWTGGGEYGYSDRNANPTEWITPDGASTYYLHVTIKDGRGGEAEKGLNVTVAVSAAENYDPIILGGITINNLPGDDTPYGGPYKAGEVHYRVQVDAGDPDGDPLTYSWTGGGEYGYSDRNANPTEWITPDAAGTYYLHVTVKDGRGGEIEEGLNVSVE